MLSLPSEKEKSTLETTGQGMEEQWSLTHMIADLNKEKETCHLNQNKQRL